MTSVTVPAGRVRVPDDVRGAVDRRDPVTVTDRDKPAYVILHPDEYAYVRPILERRRRGLPTPIEHLLTDEDLAIMAMDEEPDVLGDAILSGWDD